MIGNAGMILAVRDVDSSLKCKISLLCASSSAFKCNTSWLRRSKAVRKLSQVALRSSRSVQLSVLPLFK